MSSATITSVTGPAVTVTAGVYQNVQRFELNAVNQTLQIYFIRPGQDTIKNQIFDLTADTSFTLTYSAPNYTLTIS